MLTHLHSTQHVQVPRFILSAPIHFPGVPAAAAVPGDGSQAESVGHCGEGDVRRVKGRHHTAPPVCNLACQHSDGHDQCHLRRRAHEESTSQVTNTHWRTTSVVLQKGAFFKKKSDCQRCLFLGLLWSSSAPKWPIKNHKETYIFSRYPPEFTLEKETLNSSGKTLFRSWVFLSPSTQSASFFAQLLVTTWGTAVEQTSALALTLSCGLSWLISVRHLSWCTVCENLVSVLTRVDISQ